MSERNNFLDRHAPVQYLADKMKAEGAHTSLTMSEHGALGFSDRLLERSYVSFGNRVHPNRDESVGKVTSIGCATFDLISGLGCILPIRTVIDERFEAVAA